MDRNHTILHVDDDPSILRLVAKRLSKESYDVVSIDDPTKVSKALLKTGARVVLLDIDMPQIDGLTLLKQIKEQDGGIQVIMLTGLVSIHTALLSMRYGAEACLFKPLTDFDPLLTSVQAAFEKIGHWWEALHDLNHRKSEQQHQEADSSAFMA